MLFWRIGSSVHSEKSKAYFQKSKVYFFKSKLYFFESLLFIFFVLLVSWKRKSLLRTFTPKPA